MDSQSTREVLNALIDELFQLNGRVLAAGDELSATHGLTGARWQVMAALQLEERPLTVAQIARRMGLQRQSVQRLCDILVAQGVLSYRDNPDHKRAKLVDFTAKGREIFDKMDVIQLEWADSITADFCIEDLESTARVLRKLKDKIG
jgi:DNA-binding MarR family transcriptional regulator